MNAKKKKSEKIVKKIVHLSSEFKSKWTKEEKNKFPMKLKSMDYLNWLNDGSKYIKIKIKWYRWTEDPTSDTIHMHSKSNLLLHVS